MIDETTAGSSENPRVSSNGNVVFVWRRGYKLLASQWLSTTPPPTTLFQADPSVFSPFIDPYSIATGPLGHAVVVFSEQDKRGRYNVMASLLQGGTTWATTPTVIDSTTSRALGLSLAMNKDGGAVAAWTQGTSMYANFLSLAGTWSGVRTMTKANAAPDGIVIDSRFRGHAIWDVTEKVKKVITPRIYSAVVTNVSSGSWTPKQDIKPAGAPNAFGPQI